MGADAGDGRRGVLADGGEGVSVDRHNVVVVGDVTDEPGGLVTDGGGKAAIGDVVVGLTDGVCGEDGVGGEDRGVGGWCDFRYLHL